MLSIINNHDLHLWESALEKVPQADVYYKFGYMRAFSLHGDGEPLLFHYVNNDLHGICAMMLRDISYAPPFKGVLPIGEFYDIITPYGYGGFVFNRNPSCEELEGLKAELLQVLNQETVVSAFFRFHPILNNADFHRDIIEVVNLGKTISIDLSSPETIWSNITSKNRNVIRKAEKKGVMIKMGRSPRLLDEFQEIYNATMDNDNADKYYYFDKGFYQSLDNDLHDNYQVFYAVLEDKIIAMSIILFSGTSMHYHLSGSLLKYRNYAPSNMLLYNAALWGNKQGFMSFHLGGGVGAGEDNLYKFKAAFNRNSDCNFSIGKLIVNKDKYDYLLSLRHNISADSKFFPKYRI